MKDDIKIFTDEYCDGFVGIKFVDGEPQITVPIGYSISDDISERRKDAFRLLGVLKKFTDHHEGDSENSSDDQISSIPIESYLYIIQDFLSHGYYTEKEARYIRSSKGKINWKKTIQLEQPQVDNGNAVYLTFQVKTDFINNNNEIRRIHRYCVYQSLFRFGWLFLSSDYLPEKPEKEINKTVAISILSEALNNTFNDNKKKLFQNMINILCDNNDALRTENFSIGVNKFAPVWERLIDYVFGIEKSEVKEKYFPHASWYIVKDDLLVPSSSLRPDTIMKYNNKTYILDAKYYQYGIDESNYNRLPGTDSIQKQFTYGKHAGSEKPYNAFIMPYTTQNSEIMKLVSIGTVDWQKNFDANTPNYAYILGILLDTRHLITTYSKHNVSEIEKMAGFIENSLNKYKDIVNKKING